MNELASSVRQALAPFKRRFAWAALYFVGVLLIGVAGYRRIEGWDFSDAFYMSVTTVSAVGFREVQPLSSAGRALTT